MHGGGENFNNIDSKSYQIAKKIDFTLIKHLIIPCFISYAIV